MNELRKRLQQKRKSSKGFTLMEMLIVVAIIAILVAIAIPTFNSSLEKARQATDQANARTLKSVCVTAYMLDNKKTGTFGLDASSGTAIDSKETKAYEKAYKTQSAKYGKSSDTVLTCTIREAAQDDASNGQVKGQMIVTMSPKDILDATETTSTSGSGT